MKAMPSFVGAMAGAVVSVCLAGPRRPGDNRAPPATRPAAPATAPSPARLRRLWDALGSADANKAGEAVTALAALGDPAVAFLAGVLEPPPAPAGQVERLVASLDDARYVIRRRAYGRLEQMGRAAVPTLKQALGNRKLPLETRSRIEQLILDAFRPREGSVAARRLEGAACALARVRTARSRRLLAGLARDGWLPWGSPVRGVQVRLRAADAAQRPGDVLVLFADIRNRGPLDLHVCRDFHNGWEVEADGRWYVTVTKTTALRVSLPAGGRQMGIEIDLTEDYRDRPGSARRDPGPLVIRPGRHRIRVAAALQSAGDSLVPLRALSNAVEIVVVPAPATQPSTKAASPPGPKSSG